MSDLSRWRVTFSRSDLFGWWGWEAKGPRGQRLSGLGVSVTKAAAEREAFRRLSLYADPETIDGDELSQRVRGAA